MLYILNRKSIWSHKFPNADSFFDDSKVAKFQVLSLVQWME